jgi:hypothetical protein
MNIISTVEAVSYLWLSWEDSLIEILNGIATQKIYSFLNIDWILEKEYEEKYNFTDIFYLKQLKPISINEIDWVLYNWIIWTDYILEWRQLKFYLPLICNDVRFNKIKFKYTAWFEEIPADIKQVALNLIWFYYNNRKTNWITSFTQWQITVNYWNNKTQNETEESILSWLKKYKKNNIYATNIQ